MLITSVTTADDVFMPVFASKSEEPPPIQLGVPADEQTSMPEEAMNTSHNKHLERSPCCSKRQKGKNFQKEHEQTSQRPSRGSNFFVSQYYPDLGHKPHKSPSIVEETPLIATNKTVNAPIIPRRTNEVAQKLSSRTEYISSKKKCFNQCQTDSVLSKGIYTQQMNLVKMLLVLPLIKRTLLIYIRNTLNS